MKDLIFVNEIWKPIIGYEQFYEVSNLGNIKSLRRIAYYRNDPKRGYFKKEKILKFTSNHGSKYKVVKLYDGSAIGKVWLVHRLVALHFVPNYHNLRIVNHIDGDPSNNRSSNLEWCTNSYNTRHAYETGLKKPENYKGSASTSSKLTEKQVINIRLEYKVGNTSYPKLAKKYNISPSNVFTIVKRQTWNHV